MNCDKIMIKYDILQQNISFSDYSVVEYHISCSIKNEFKTQKVSATKLNFIYINICCLPYLKETYCI